MSKKRIRSKSSFQGKTKRKINNFSHTAVRKFSIFAPQWTRSFFRHFLFFSASFFDQRATHAKQFQADLKPGSINLAPAHVKFKSIAGCFRALFLYASEMVIATSYFFRKSANDFQICAVWWGKEGEGVSRIFHGRLSCCAKASMRIGIWAMLLFDFWAPFSSGGIVHEIFLV